MPEPLIVAHQLVKRFGDFTAVAGIDVQVQPGEVFGFLGSSNAIFSGVFAGANSAGVTSLTFLSGVWAERATATSNS